MMVSTQHQLLPNQLLIVYLLLPLPLHASVRQSHTPGRDSDASVRDKVATCLDQLFQADIAFWLDSQVRIFNVFTDTQSIS